MCNWKMKTGCFVQRDYGNTKAPAPGAQRARPPATDLPCGRGPRRVVLLLCWGLSCVTLSSVARGFSRETIHENERVYINTN